MLMLDSRRHESLTSQMSLMVVNGEKQMEEDKRFAVAQVMQKRRKGRTQQQVFGNGSTGVGRAATSWSLVWRGDIQVEDGKATVVRPASIARHNLSPPSPILPTNDVLVAPCLATTSVGRVFFFTSAALQETLFL